MKISITGKYKSISDFESEMLEDFTVITGKNGSGKSQLLRSIYLKLVPNNDENESKSAFNITIEPKVNEVHSGSLSRTVGVITKEHFTRILQGFSTRHQQLSKLNRSIYLTLFDADLSIEDFLNFSLKDLSTRLEIENETDFLRTALTELQGSPVPQHRDSEFLLTRIKSILKAESAYFSIILIIKNFKNKQFSEIEHNDFFTTPIPEKLLDNPMLFDFKAEVIFRSYLSKRYHNDHQFYRKERFGDNNNAISDEEFIKQFPPPWATINKLLNKHELDLQIRGYELSDYSEDIVVTVRFFKSSFNVDLGFDQLSSGEQIIVSLILKLFARDFYSKDLRYPDLILLDEPDAYLHPEMCKLLVDVLFQSFVKELGIKVIITTHSPSTVALAPEESIFEMNNSPFCSLKKITKDAALVLLTGALPTLTIDYKNHKQVFVESPTDRYYFQTLFDKIHENLPFQYRLYFISNQSGKGNSDWVGDIVSKLRAAGVQKAYGIIDWDLDKNNTEHTLVHGFGARYSIENYLYDAVYLAILFLQNNANNIRSAIGVKEHDQPYSLAEANAERLQEIWRWLTEELNKRFPAITAGNDNEFEIEYLSGIKLKVPQWYLLIQGHELEEKLRTIFPSLAKYSGEGLLQKELTIIMVRCYPFIPKDSYNLLSVIAN